MKKKNDKKPKLCIIAITIIVFGFVFLTPKDIDEDIKYVFAESLLTLGVGLLGFLLGEKIKEKINFKIVTIIFAIIFCLLAWSKLLTYNCVGDRGKIILSALLSGITGVWFSNISAEKIE